MQQEHERFLALWNGLAKADGIARLSQLDLRAIVPLLPWITILEIDDAGDLLFRLGGTGLEAEIGCGLRGRKLVELCRDRKTADMAVAFLLQAMKSWTGLYLNGHFTSQVHQRQQLSGLGLPFLDDKSSSRKDKCIFFQVWLPLERRNRDFTNLWGKLDLVIDEMFEVHVGDPIDRTVVPADVQLYMRNQGIAAGHMPVLRAVPAVTD